MATTKLQE